MRCFLSAPVGQQHGSRSSIWRVAFELLRREHQMARTLGGPKTGNGTERVAGATKAWALCLVSARLCGGSRHLSEEKRCGGPDTGLMHVALPFRNLDFTRRYGRGPNVRAHQFADHHSGQGPCVTVRRHGVSEQICLNPSRPKRR